MSTYTDLHNRVQESINVDYNSRVTPQKVKFHNVENEYWGTFKGTMQVDNVALSGGSLSDVTLTNVKINGATFTNVDDLNIRMDDYVDKSAFALYSQGISDQITVIREDARSARDSVANVSSDLKDRIQGVKATVDAWNSSVDSTIASKIDVVKQTLSIELTAGINAAQGDARNALQIAETTRDQLNSKISEEDSDRRDANLSTDLTNLINTLSTSIVGPNGTVPQVSSELNTLIETYHDQHEEDVDTLDHAIQAEATAREDADDVLSGAIDAIYKNANGAESGKLVNVSAELNRQITAEASTRNSEDVHLSNLIVGLSGDLTSEVLIRARNDGELQAKILSVQHDYISADDAILETTTNVSNAIDQKIDDKTDFLLSVVEHDRHYILNKGTNGHFNSDYYPLSAKDMAVNIFDVNIPDAKLVYKENENGIYAEIARMFYVDDVLQVKTYAGLEDKHNGISKGLIDDYTYNFNKVSTQVETKNGYTFSYIPSLTSDDLLDDAAKFELNATQLSYYNLVLSGTQTVIGKVFDLSVGGGSVLSGKYNIEVRPTDELYPFNRFKGIEFNNTDNQVSAIDSNRIRYDDNNRLVLEYGVNHVPYFKVFSTDNHLLGRVYSKAGAEDGIQVDLENKITCIRVNDIEDDITRFAYLNNENKYCATLSSYVGYGNKTYNRYLSVDVDDNYIATFKMYDAAHLYKYPFAFTSFDGNDQPDSVGYIVPILYNKTISEALDNVLYLAMIREVEVDLRDVVVADCFKRNEPYKLQKRGQKEWFYEERTDDGLIQITYSNFNILKVHYIIEKSADELEAEGLQQNEFTHIMYVSMIPEPDSYAYDSGDLKNEHTAVVDLKETFFNPNVEEPEARDYVEKTYYASFDNGNPIISELTPYEFDIEKDGMNEVSIVFPSKEDYEDPTYDVSREFLLALRFNSKSDGLVNVKFVKEDGLSVTFYNNKKQELLLEPNRWTTLQINEVQPNKFLVTDLNQNEDRLKFAGLSARLSTEIDDRTSETSYLSAQLSDAQVSAQYNRTALDWLSGELSDTMRFKGDVLLKEDYNPAGADPRDDHRHLSMLLGTCVGNSADAVLERGYLFRCKVENDLSAKCTFTFTEGVAEETALSLDNNDYIILKKDCTLGETRISDVEVIKDFTNYIERLSSASDGKYFMLSGNNVVHGDNTFVENTYLSNATIFDLTCENTATIQSADISYAAVTKLSVDDLSATMLSVASLSGTKLSAASLSGTDVSAANLSATALSVASLSTTAISAASLSGTDLSANNLSTTKLSVASLSGIDVSATNVSATAISAASLSGTDVSANNLSATKLSVNDASMTKLSVASLSGTDLSVANLSATKLSVNDVSANALSANALSATALSAASLSGTDLSAANLSATKLSVDDISAAKLSVNDLSATKLSVASLSGTDLSANNLSGTNISAANLSAAKLSVASLSGTDLSANNLSAAKLSVNDLSATKLSTTNMSATAISVASLSGTDLSANNLSATNLSVAKLSGTDLSVNSLSGTNISATNLTSINLTGTSAYISSLYVNALSNVVDRSTTSSLQNTVDDINTRLNTVSVVVDDALSANCELPTHSHENDDHSVTNLTAVVSKLLLVDEATYDVYALTMRNGALNVDKVGHWPDKHPHPHSK